MKKYFGFSVLYALPLVTFAAAPANLADLIKLVQGYLNSVIPLIFSIAIVFFLIGILKFFIGGEEKLAEAKQMALWGIIALFVMVSVWGFVNILLKTFGFSSDIPTVPGSSSERVRTNLDNPGTNLINTSDAYGGEPPAARVYAPDGGGAGSDPEAQSRPSYSQPNPIPPPTTQTSKTTINGGTPNAQTYSPVQQYKDSTSVPAN